jgi:CubicO group peptidase (beta-lactamase class C family)
MRNTSLRGRICADVVGSTDDMVLLAKELLSPTLLSSATHRQMVTPYLPELAGITPPFGRQTPNWWGLGPELKGAKEHWMGHWPAESFGHFGRSGSMLLADPTTGLFIVATSTEEFGAWAVALWPTWVDDVRRVVLS